LSQKRQSPSFEGEGDKMRYIAKIVHHAPAASLRDALVARGENREHQLLIKSCCYLLGEGTPLLRNATATNPQRQRHLHRHRHQLARVPDCLACLGWLGWWSAECVAGEAQSAYLEECG
jgi:hypothetical protein